MICSLICAVLSAAFLEGERVAFFGDSISQNGYQTFQIQLSQTLMHPGKPVRIENIGTSGDTPSGGLDRWDWDAKPCGTQRRASRCPAIGDCANRACYDLSLPETETRELAALQEAKTETGIANCMIVTDDEERETEDGIRILPAWKWLLNEGVGNGGRADDCDGRGGRSKGS